MDTCVVDNFEKVCRICMKFDKTFLSITSFQIIDMIIAFASVQIWENDDLPNQICHDCFLQLQTTINFKQLCENSDNTFRQIVRRNKINLPNAPNDFHHVKDEKFEDYADNNSPIDIKEEVDISENTTHENLENEKIKLDHKKDDSKKLETSTILEIETKDRPELNKSKISAKSENGSDTCEDAKDDDDNVGETFSCEKCGKEFKKIWALGKHMHSKHKAKVLNCNKCELKFYHPLHLKEHQGLTHNPSNFTCNTCNKVYTNIYDLKRHKFRESTLQCPHCDKSFLDKCSFKKHKKEVHSRIEKYVTCHICGRSITKKCLQNHLETHNENRDKAKCHICSKELSQQSLQNHVRQVHGDQKAIRNHLCNICGFAARKPSDLQRHLLIHSTERPYACDRCDKTYRREDSLKQHISHVHLNERKHQCKYCSQAFYERRHLIHHERRHTGEKPHKCEVCGKAFAQKTALITHTKIHTNSRDNLIQS